MRQTLQLLLLVFVTLSTSAQIQRTPAKQKADSSAQMTRPDETTNNRMQIFKELNLTKEQKITMKDLRDQHKDAKDAIENDSTLSYEQKNEKLKQLKKQQAAKIQEILTEEQRVKFREIRLKNKNNE